jgi:hypothetical protein
MSHSRCSGNEYAGHNLPRKVLPPRSEAYHPVLYLYITITSPFKDVGIYFKTILSRCQRHALRYLIDSCALFDFATIVRCEVVISFGT